LLLFDFFFFKSPLFQTGYLALVLHLKLLQIILSAIFAVFIIALLLFLRESGLRYLILDHNNILDMMIALMMLRGSYHLLTLNVIIIYTPKQSTTPGTLSVDLTRR
jgi:hypothetical protein